MRDRAIDSIRAIAIFFVVLGHVLIACEICPQLVGAIYSFHMPVLFSLSGYVISVAYERRPDALGRIRSSALHLMVPYLIWSALIAPMCASFLKGTSLAGEFSAALGYTFVTNHGMWYLPCCFLLICVYVGADTLSRRWHFRLAFASAAFVALALVLIGYWLTGIDFLRSVVCYWVSFFLGVAFARRRFTAASVGWPLALLSSAVWSVLVLLPCTAGSALLKPITGALALLPLAWVAKRMNGRIVAGVWAIGESTLLIYGFDHAMGFLLAQRLCPASLPIAVLWSVVVVVAIASLGKTWSALVRTGRDLV